MNKKKNAQEIMSTNEDNNFSKESKHAQQIMSQIRDLYVINCDLDKPEIANSPEISLLDIAKDLQLPIYAPRKKVNVLIIGNHSAGKSSFINWYTGDDIQSTGVAIETQGFTFITSGTTRTKAPIKGESTIMMFPYLQKVKQDFGKHLVENLSTCVSTSKAKHFRVVDFIDSPGLVDGDISYPFDVNNAIFCIAENVDLIFVFLDPMGQALCSRTMKVVKLLNTKYSDKMKYYLTKADTVSSPKELMKLMVQITQNIKENINNLHGLEIPAFWLPSVSSGKDLDEDLNQIHSLCDVIEKSIHQKVQDNLSQVEEDCNIIRRSVRQHLHQDFQQHAAKRSREAIATGISIIAWFIPFIFFVSIVVNNQKVLPAIITDADMVMHAFIILNNGFAPLFNLDGGVMDSIKKLGICLIFFLILVSISKFIRSRAQQFHVEGKGVISRWKNYESVLDSVMKRRKELFAEYVSTYMHSEDH